MLQKRLNIFVFILYGLSLFLLGCEEAAETYEVYLDIRPSKGILEKVTLSNSQTGEVMNIKDLGKINEVSAINEKTARIDLLQLKEVKQLIDKLSNWPVEKIAGQTALAKIFLKLRVGAEKKDIYFINFEFGPKKYYLNGTVETGVWQIDLLKLIKDKQFQKTLKTHKNPHLYLNLTYEEAANTVFLFY